MWAVSPAGGDRLLDNCAIATVDAGEEYLGAVAGDADLDDGTVRGNRFVDTGLAAIDGVSYAGKAEPVAFEVLRQESGIPTEFISFTLTLKAGEDVVARIPVPVRRRPAPGGAAGGAGAGGKLRFLAGI